MFYPLFLMCMISGSVSDKYPSTMFSGLQDFTRLDLKRFGGHKDEVSIYIDIKHFFRALCSFQCNYSVLYVQQYIYPSWLFFGGEEGVAGWVMPGGKVYFIKYRIP